MAAEALRGRRILVTGGSSGIGAATVRELVGSGAAVAALARRSDRLAQLHEEVGAVPVVADVTDEESVGRAVGHAAESLGGLDGLVNNAGVLRVGSVETMPAADMRLMLDVNVLGLLLVTQAAVPHLRASGSGDVVNVSSMFARRAGRPEAAVYRATKHAVHALGDGLRRQLHADGIRVMTVTPGLTTSELSSGLTDDLRTQAERRQQEIGLPAEVIAREIAGCMARPRTVLTVEVSVTSAAQYD